MAKKAPPPASELTQRPFAQLARTLGASPTAAPESAPAVTTASTTAPLTTAPRIARAVVRYEKKGRGGKEVTVVEKLGLREAELATWLKALKQSLGTGGVVEEGTLVLQGDQRARVGALLTARGVRKVTIA